MGSKLRRQRGDEGLDGVGGPADGLGLGLAVGHDTREVRARHQKGVVVVLREYD